MIRKIGLPINFCAIRFESKHNFFMMHHKISQNHRNPALTMATRHQYHLTSILERGIFLAGEFTLIHESIVRRQDVPNYIDGLHELIKNDSKIKKGTGLKFLSNNYTTEMVVCVDMDVNTDTPIFAKIEGIFVVDDTPLLHLNQYKTESFKRHYQTYMLSIPNLRDESYKQYVSTVPSLYDFHPLPLYEVDGQYATILHHFIETE